MRGTIFYRGATMALAVMAAPSAIAQRTPAPGGVLQLKPGIYVEQGVACESAPNAAIRRYDRKGISTAHTHSCRARILSRKGRTFSMTQTCVDAGAGPGPKFTERMSVTVPDALTFSVRKNGAGTTYRYCAPRSLPPGMNGF